MGCVAPVYRPRDAEHTVLHQVIAEHLEAFLGAVAEAGDGAGLPQFVEREFREFLLCGVYEAGVARFQCEGCARENEDKSQVVDLTKGDSFGFLGFDFRRVRSLRGRWRPQYTPKQAKRRQLLRELKEAFRRWGSQPVEKVIDAINPILRGWVNYFRVGNSARCFDYVKNWVERKVRRHLMGARKRQGFGWKRWSTAWLYNTLGLFRDYRVQHLSRA